MTKHMGHHGPPSSYVADGGTWPDGPLKKGAPPEAVVAQTIAKAFRDRYEIKDWNPTAAADRLRVSRTVIYNILNGDAWMSMGTILRIEQYLGKRLWMSGHLFRPEDQPSRSDATNDA